MLEQLGWTAGPRHVRHVALIAEITHADETAEEYGSREVAKRVEE